jgi:hypothetical protein
MADAMEIVSADGTPAIPPPPRSSHQLYIWLGGGDGRIWPSASKASAAGVSTTPNPPQRILLQAGSAVSPITNAATASSGNAMHGNEKTNTPRKGNVPKQKFPDFSRPYSKDNAYLLGDESGKWGKEAENIAERIAEANAMEQLVACTLTDPVEEVTEPNYLLSNIGEDGDEGNADEEEGGGLFETILINKKTTATEMKVICKALALNSSGNKTALFQRIRDSGINVIDRIDDETFYYRRRMGEIDTSLPCWIILNPDPAPAVEGIDMLRGAKERFYGPTNQENSIGAPKFSTVAARGTRSVGPSLRPRRQIYEHPKEDIFLRLH